MHMDFLLGYPRCCRPFDKFSPPLKSVSELTVPCSLLSMSNDRKSRGPTAATNRPG